MEWFHTQTGTKLKRFHSDEGTEFTNYEVQQTLKENGIEQTFSNPYCPMQNGIAERANRTLLDLTRTILIASKLPQYLWGEAIMFTCTILNAVTIKKGASKTAYELIYNKKAYLGKLHPFGTTCFTHVPKQQQKHKLESRSKKGILVGISENGTGYRIWMPETNTITKTKDVRFTTRSPLETGSIEKRAIVNEREKEKENEEKTDTNSESSEDYESEEEHEPETEKTVEKKEKTKRNLRDRSTIKIPKRYIDYEADLAENEDKKVTEPKTYKECLESPQREEWLKAMNEELRSKNDHSVWTMTNLPKNQKAIGSRWIYKIKRDPNGEPDKYKARLVVKGYTQREGIDYTELFSPVARFETIRTILSIAATEELVVYQFDVKTAFLYAELQEEVYMNQPPGFEDGSNKVCKLNKALYGLKQAPRTFHHKIRSILLEQRLTQSKSDECVFYRNAPEKLILCIYVDDAIVCGKSKNAVMNLLKTIETMLTITYKPLSFFLGIQVEINEKKDIFIHQQQYINDMLHKFQMNECKGVSTPMERDIYNETEQAKPTNYPYRELIGTLMYLAIATRLDISFAVAYLSRYLERPTEKHWNAAMRILKYLKNTKKYGIMYESRKQGKIRVFSDSDYGSCPETRKSTSGQLVCRGEAAIYWSSQKQPSVALSSTEAEFVAAADTAKTAIWITRLIEELHEKVTPNIQIDNESAIKLIKNNQFYKKTKHIEIRYQFIRDLHEKGKITVSYTPTEEQLADILTKPLTRVIFERLRDQTGTKCSEQLL